jgi:hypothetical protein
MNENPNPKPNENDRPMDPCGAPDDESSMLDALALWPNAEALGAETELCDPAGQPAGRTA